MQQLTLRTLFWQIFQTMECGTGRRQENLPMAMNSARECHLLASTTAARSCRRRGTVQVLARVVLVQCTREGG